MSVDNQLKVLLRELSSAISRCLSAPENLLKLEKLQKSGYEIYLILEPVDDQARKVSPEPIFPLHPTIVPKTKVGKTTSFDLSEEDKDFLRTLKIKVD